MIIVKAYTFPDDRNDREDMWVGECERFEQFNSGARVELHHTGTSIRTELTCGRGEAHPYGFMDIYFENDRGRTIHHISYDNIK